MNSKLKITATILVALIVFAACDLVDSNKSDAAIADQIRTAK